MTKNRLKLAAARHTLSLALNRPIALAADVTAIEPRHLLRALLRQCSYLPDATARDFFHGYIIDRYRNYRRRPPQPSISPTPTPDRCRSLHKEARKGLLFLKRANDGHPTHLFRVLAMAYGRTGKKRHELLKGVLSSSVFKTEPSPTNERALARLSDGNTKTPSESNKENRLQTLHTSPSRAGSILGPRLEALIAAQKHQKHSEVSNKIAKKPRIPETDKWGRSMPRCRVANMNSRWYAELLSKIVPPLPESDWNMLRDLALGRVPAEGALRRRTSLAQIEFQEFGRKGSQPINIDGANPHPGVSSILENQETIQKQNRKLLGSNPHTITPRYMRRLRGRIFLQCPLMKWDAERRRWDVTWGNLQKSKEISLGLPGRMNMDMFKGVDEAGNVVSS